MKLPAMLVLGALASLTVATPTATAAPCSASGLANTASGVLAQAGAYLDAHPGANDALTNAGSSGDAVAPPKPVRTPSVTIATRRPAVAPSTCTARIVVNMSLSVAKEKPPANV